MKNDKKKKEKIDVSKLLTNFLGSRDLIDILEKRIKKSKTKNVVLDFSDVEFVSRSVAHALLLMREKFQPEWNLLFINTAENVADMLRIVAANLAVPKKKKPNFNPEKVDAVTLFKRKSE